MSENNQTTKIQKRATVRIAMCASYVALIIVCSLIAFPQPFSTVSISLSLLAVLLFPALDLDGVYAVLIFILMGAVGIPVFASFKAADALLGPAGGYIIGYIPAALIAFLTSRIAFSVEKKLCFIKYAKKARTKDSLPNKTKIVTIIILASGFSLAVCTCYALGTLRYMQYFNQLQNKNFSLASALTACVVPFLIGDACKIALAVLLVCRLKKHRYFL